LTKDILDEFSDRINDMSDPKAVGILQMIANNLRSDFDRVSDEILNPKIEDFNKKTDQKISEAGKSIDDQIRNSSKSILFAYFGAAIVLIISTQFIINSITAIAIPFFNPAPHEVIANSIIHQVTSDTDNEIGKTYSEVNKKLRDNADLLESDVKRFKANYEEIRETGAKIEALIEISRPSLGELRKIHSELKEMNHISEISEIKANQIQILDTNEDIKKKYKELREIAVITLEQERQINILLERIRGITGAEATFVDWMQKQISPLKPKEAADLVDRLANIVSIDEVHLRKGNCPNEFQQIGSLKYAPNVDVKENEESFLQVQNFGAVICLDTAYTKVRLQ